MVAAAHTPRRRSGRHRPGGRAAAALLAADARLSAALFRAGSGVPRPLWLLLELGGNGLVWLAAALVAILLPATSPGARGAWCNLLVAWAVDLALVGALKGAVRRPRPAYNLRSDFAVVVPLDAHSFPSGHSSRVSFVAIYAAVLLGRSHPGLCAAVGCWAAATALSRAAMGRHYLLDVVAGLALGAVTVAIATRGSFSRSGLWVAERHSEAALAAVQGAARRAAAATTGWL